MHLLEAISKSALLALLVLGVLAQAGDYTWPVKELFQTPDFRKASDEFPEKDSILPLYYKNGPCRGRETEVFAWLGIPETASPSAKVPGIVLVHGGGGTAYRAWVDIWKKRGYAAIAMDITGGVPKDENLDSHECKFVPSEIGGPNLNKTFRETRLPIDDQWAVYAIKAIIRAHSLLRSLPEVDATRIGLTGGSWGAVTGEIATALDPRVAFAAFVYGSGFIGDSSFFKAAELDKLPEAERTFWLSHFDPSNYVGQIKCPVLFANGATDKHFRPDSWWRTVRLLPAKQVWLSYNTFMRHTNLPACDPPEVAAFADSWAFKKQSSPKMQSMNGNTAVFSAPAGIAEAVFCWTCDTSEWPRRKWQTAPATLDGSTVSIGAIPENATAYFFRIIDKNGLAAATYPVVQQE